MLSINNGEGIGKNTMEVAEEVKMTPTGNKATTPVAFPKPLAQSRSDDPASDNTKMFKIAAMTSKYEQSRMSEVNEESK